jgi:hypothetical protein
MHLGGDDQHRLVAGGKVLRLLDRHDRPEQNRPARGPDAHDEPTVEDGIVRGDLELCVAHSGNDRSDVRTADGVKATSR